MNLEGLSNSRCSYCSYRRCKRQAGPFEAVSIWTSVFTYLRLHFRRERRIGSGTNPERLPWGKDLGVRLQDNRDLFIDRSRTGQLELSIRHDIQLIARAAMAGQVGSSRECLTRPQDPYLACGVLRSSTRTICLHDLSAVTSDYEALSSDPNQPLLNRAEFQSYDIGSLFTIVTAANSNRRRLT